VSCVWLLSLLDVFLGLEERRNLSWRLEVKPYPFPRFFAPAGRPLCKREGVISALADTALKSILRGLSRAAIHDGSPRAELPPRALNSARRNRPLLGRKPCNRFPHVFPKPRETKSSLVPGERVVYRWESFRRDLISSNRDRSRIETP
jgi:hypothetical protein